MSRLPQKVDMQLISRSSNQKYDMYVACLLAFNKAAQKGLYHCNICTDVYEIEHVAEVVKELKSLGYELGVSKLDGTLHIYWGA